LLQSEIAEQTMKAVKAAAGSPADLMYELLKAIPKEISGITIRQYLQGNLKQMDEKRHSPIGRQSRHVDDGDDDGASVADDSDDEQVDNVKSARRRSHRVRKAGLLNLSELLESESEESDDDDDDDVDDDDSEEDDNKGEEALARNQNSPGGKRKRVDDDQWDPSFSPNKKSKVDKEPQDQFNGNSYDDPVLRIPSSSHLDQQIAANLGRPLPAPNGPFPSVSGSKRPINNVSTQNQQSGIFLKEDILKLIRFVFFPLRLALSRKIESCFFFQIRLHQQQSRELLHKVGGQL
jgi:hypothetical protein